MLISAPVYSDENGLHHISIYVEDEDGTFRRTMEEPLRLLRDNIKGISISQGELLSKKSDRHPRKWGSPTVTYNYGRPQSFYYFLREKLSKNKFFVFSKSSLSGRLSKLQLHELLLLPSTSQRQISLLKEKYMESVGLWSGAEYEKYLEKRNASQIRRAKSARPKTLTQTKNQSLSIKESREGKIQIENASYSPNFTHQSTQKLVKKDNDSHFYRRFICLID